jgi:hypothetical protein
MVSQRFFPISLSVIVRKCPEVLSALFALNVLTVIDSTNRLYYHLPEGLAVTAIEVDFEVYKALTLLRESETTTYNDVIRQLLKLGKPKQNPASASAKGATYKGIFFPDGTLFEATYKGRRYTAHIQDGVWIDDLDGKPRTSPSHAVNKLTGTTVNGWRFWRCRRPGETSWILLDKLQ